jgi:hypothetical protein
MVTASLSFVLIESVYVNSLQPDDTLRAGQLAQGDSIYVSQLESKDYRH